VEELLPISPMKDVTFRTRIIHMFTIKKITPSWCGESALVHIRTDAKPLIWSFIIDAICKSDEVTHNIVWKVQVHNLIEGLSIASLKLYMTNNNDSFDFYIQSTDAALYFLTIQKIGLNPTHTDGNVSKSSEMIIHADYVSALPDGAEEILVGGI
jgi:hypothetical protein